MRSGGAALAYKPASRCDAQQAPPSSRFFTEYVEGASTDKALEITNAGAARNLDGCELRIYRNGATTPSATYALSGTLALGASYTQHRGADLAAGYTCNQRSSGFDWNGNDALALVCVGVTMDVFGQIGANEIWTSGDVSATDAVLRRHCEVTQGDTISVDAFDVAAEWSRVPQVSTAYDFRDLGHRTCP